ncbi:hypothetical protein LIER_30581 [Lithospermum erythrorhizon]|uniref:Uncharacterized protein n=1 Tax=Lithospermum erythrorhizon TaxID=34254 RepID=A0AAV3RRU2_LITER
MLTPYAERKLAKWDDKSHHFKVNQLPCSHAIRASREHDLSIYIVVSRLYTLECLRMAYAIPVNPVQHRSE